MRSSILVVLFTAASCTQGAPSPVVTAPSAATVHGDGAQEGRSHVSPLPESGPAEGDARLDAEYRGCHSDADCVAVPRPSCCNNGWKDAVAASQAQRYASNRACKAKPRPACPMYIVRDTHIAKCDAELKLCILATP